MSTKPETTSSIRVRDMHGLGVVCGIGAGVWLGAAEAPTKLVNAGLSPYAISLCMVAGVFTARWSVPTLLKGTRSVFRDLGRNRQLIPFAVLAGMLWAVANTLTVFAIRDVGLAVAFPLWNTNSLFGILWGWLLFGELRGASAANIAKVLLGTLAIVSAAVMLGFSTMQMHAAAGHGAHALNGILAAIGASVLWGSMYIPYRKAYLSGMNPLSFVTVFTVGELVTMFALVLAFDGGVHAAVFHSPAVAPMLFWLFLGGFVWVVGDLFQQYATKYLGIGRGIPLSNTNQLWGLAWGALVFGELAHADTAHRLLVVAGSLAMIAGAMAVSSAIATERESTSTHEAIERECERYGLEHEHVVHAFNGTAARDDRREWWDWLILACAAGAFIALALKARVPALAMNYGWAVVLTVIMIATATFCAWKLHSRTRFS
jgi:drug/metabolite transporter (DMT)-like permease